MIEYRQHRTTRQRVGREFSLGRHIRLPVFASFFFGMAVELLEKMEIKVYNESRMMFSGERRAA